MCGACQRVDWLGRYTACHRLCGVQEQLAGVSLLAAHAVCKTIDHTEEFPSLVSTAQGVKSWLIS